MSVTFTSTVLGLQTGTLTFTDNAANSPQTVPLSGTGVAPATLTPTSATYAARAVGTTECGENIYPDQQSDRDADRNRDLDHRRLRSLGDDLHDKLGDQGEVHDQRDVHADSKRDEDGQLSVSDSASNSPQTANLTGTGK